MNIHYCQLQIPLHEFFKGAMLLMFYISIHLPSIGDVLMQKYEVWKIAKRNEKKFDRKL